MKIGIDISAIVYGTGVSSYTRNLVDSLLKIDQEDKFILFGGSLRRFNDLNQWSRQLKGNFETKFVKFPPRLLDFVWNRGHVLPFERLSGHIDIYHSSDWAQAPSKAYKVTTVHDLVPIRFPNISHPRIVSAHKRRLNWVKKEVDKIIAVSEFTKKELIDLYDIPEDKVSVIYEAADPDLKKASAEKIKGVKEKYGIKEEYLLVVGTDPRKNVSVIIQAFSKIRKSLTGTILVIAGRMWEELPYTSEVSVLGHISREDLNVLYSGASALIYTSLYEGFGLPILEAMTVSCPVVTSNVSSMPEIAGGAAVLVNPKKVSEIAEGIKEVLKNPDKWSKLGISRAKQFSWEKTAKETLVVYNLAK